MMFTILLRGVVNIMQTALSHSNNFSEKAAHIFLIKMQMLSNENPPSIVRCFRFRSEQLCFQVLKLNTFSQSLLYNNDTPHFLELRTHQGTLACCFQPKMVF